MKKISLLILLAFCNLLVHSQQLNNEWIDYSKTYYKFKIAVTGLYRITANDLNTVGLANEGVENFQLWRNGQQVPLFTSVATGAIGAGYIELYGQQNDGTLDKQLYRTPGLQLSDELSLQTDSSAYFLTVNRAGNNLRFTNTPNDIAGNLLLPEPYFMYRLRHNFRTRVHRGFAVPAGSEYLYSSSYDIGEMMSSQDIYPNAPLTVNFNNLAVATAGPNAIFRASMAGSAPNFRNYKIEINNNVVKDTSISRFAAVINVNSSVGLSVISAGNASFKISNNSTALTDRIVSGFLELTYPRTFNFGNATGFPFTLQPSATAKYVEITNFNNVRG